MKLTFSHKLKMTVLLQQIIKQQIQYLNNHTIPVFFPIHLSHTVATVLCSIENNINITVPYITLYRKL